VWAMSNNITAFVLGLWSTCTECSLLLVLFSLLFKFCTRKFYISKVIG
jgi:hypothetical protein